MTFKIFIIYFMSISPCPHQYICRACLCLVFREKRELDSVKLKSMMIVSHHLFTGNRTLVLSESSYCS